MIDTAIPDHTEDGWVNFEKKRKEFEILAQIRLLQSACQLYQLKPDAAFIEWFHSIRTYDDKERCGAHLKPLRSERGPFLHRRVFHFADTAFQLRTVVRDRTCHTLHAQRGQRTPEKVEVSNARPYQDCVAFACVFVLLPTFCICGFVFLLM